MNRSESQGRRLYRFGPYALDAMARSLTRGSSVVPLTPKAFDTLVALVENHGKVLQKAALMDLVWPDTAVEENNLAQSITAIRRALDEQPGNGGYIATVPGRGYSFIGDVSEETPSHPVRKAVRRMAVGVAAAFMMAAGFGLWLAMRRAEPQARLTTLTGANGEIGPVSFSPDGSRVAYTWRREDERTSGIYVKGIGAGDPLPLATGRHDGEPAWSPDGSYIAYYRDPPGIYLIPALGGADRKVTAVLDSAPAVKRMSWYADGKRLALADMDSDSGFRGIFEVSVESGIRRRLTAGLSTFGDRFPAVSPDGNVLAFERRPASGTGAIFVMPANGGNARRLTAPDWMTGSFDWMPDSRGMVVSATVDGFQSLWMVSSSGGDPRRIEAAGYEAVFPSVARNGTLAFSHFRNTVNIWQAPMDGSAAPRKLVETNRRQTAPVFSPDGRRFAFMSNRSGPSEIWVSDIDGGRLVAVTSMGSQQTFAGSPRWSPDGQKIAFDARPGGNPDIYIVGSYGGAMQRVTSEPAEDVLPSFSLDGRWIYFTSNRGGAFDVWRTPAGGGQAVQITRSGGVAPQESDGFVYYMDYRRQNEIWRVPVAGGAEEAVFGGASLWKGAIWNRYWGWWKPFGQNIIFVDRDSIGAEPVWAIHRFDIRARKVSTLVRLPRQPAFGDACLDISPDGRTILYTQVEEPLRTIMLLEQFR